MISISTLIFKEISLNDGDRVVLLDWEGQPQTFCNLLKLNSTGEVVWTATPNHPLDGIWTDIQYACGHLTAHNFRGCIDTIDNETGKILDSMFTK